MIQTTEHKIYYTLRIAMAMCFIGHGAFGIITKQIWCNYFGVFGIDTTLAYKLMPAVGSIDIIMGLLILTYPMRAIIWWLLGWGFLTAMLRPLSGEPIAEMLERAGNYGAPLAMLLLTRMQGHKLFSAVAPGIAHNDRSLRQVTLCLKIVVFLLFAGHGWLNLMEKKSLLLQYASLGFSNPGKVALTIGILEITAALSVLVKPVAYFVLLLFVWKMASELFYPQHEIFEWIERGGSYGSILALYFAIRKSSIYLPSPQTASASVS